MKVAVVYNRESKSVINLFGTPNREKYGLKSIKRIVNALKEGGHQAIATEGDKDLINKLEKFMPRALKGERPGLVFNLSYGIQGQARYTHVPGILEMVGVPYIGSGPLAHSLSLDKVVAKMIFRQNGLPTPDFAVLDGPNFEMPSDLTFPLIVKPKNEAVSMGLRICNDEDELREAVGYIYDKFQQPVLAEQYLTGKEINVGLLGNNPPEALTPAEIVFEGDGPPIYTNEDKLHKSGREVYAKVPARIDEATKKKAQEIAIKAFNALGCYDCARVDLRLDDEGNIYILEINSLPSLGAGGSYVAAARYEGMEFPDLVNRLVEVASARYFGTPHPPAIDTDTKDPSQQVFNYLTGRRDRIERSLQEWTALSSRTTDPVGLRMAGDKLSEFMDNMNMKPVKEYTDQRSVWTWESRAGMEDGILLVGNLDVPLDQNASVQMFRKDPEWLYGEGIGLSRAPLVSLMYAMRALKSHRLLRRVPLGVMYYTDEGRDCRYSGDIINQAMKKAKTVLVLRAGNEGDHMVTQRRGQRKYQLTVEGKPRRLGQALKKPETMQWLFAKMDSIHSLTSRPRKIAVSAVDLKVEAYPMLIPHRVSVTLLVSYLDPKTADDTEKKIRDILGKETVRWKLDAVSDRPPMKKTRAVQRLSKQLEKLAAEWDIPLKPESSIWPSAAGYSPASTGAVCGVGPIAVDLYTTHEAVKRISVIQRTLLLAQYLAQNVASTSDRRKARPKTKKAKKAKKAKGKK